MTGALSEWTMGKAVLTVFLTALMPACQGFWVHPALSSLTVSPVTASIQQGTTQQMTATGTFSDGTTENITTKVSWSTSDNTVASVGTTGMVTGVSTGSATITATSGNISGSTTLAVRVANLLSIHVNPTNGSINSGSTLQYQALGTAAGGQQYDITDSVTWTSSNPTAAIIGSTGEATAQAPPSTQQSNITASSGSIVSNTAILTVNP
jgi:trimeric autotransporter adhesin